MSCSFPAGRSAWDRTRTIRKRRRRTDVSVDDFWIDRTPVTNKQFRKFVNETGYVTVAEVKPSAGDYPGALPHMLKAGSLVFAPAESSGRPARLVAMVEFQIRRQLAAALWTAQLDQRAGRSSRRAYRLSRCRGLRGLGRQGVADRSRVGVCRARRPRRRRVRLGRRICARRQTFRQHLAGRFPAAKSRDRRLRAHVAGDGVSAERLRPLRHDRQRLGVDRRLVVAGA